MNVKYVSWFLTLVAVMTLVVIPLPSSAGKKQGTSVKVAEVNGSVITLKDLNRELDVQKRFANKGKSLDDSKLAAFKSEVLEKLIDRKLLYQESQKKKIKIETAAIDAQVNRLKKQFPDETEFKNALGKMKLSETNIRSQFEQNLAIQQFIDKQFAQKITISAEESKTYYNEHPEYFKQPVQVQASHILIKVEAGADAAKKTEAHKKIQEIQQQLQKGKDFAALAKEFSECPSSAKGGDLGYFRRGAMVKPFEESAFSLKPGEVSDIVETRFGYHLIKVIEKKAENTIAYDTTKDKINQYLKREKIQTEVSSCLAKLKKEATIKNFLK